MQAHRVNWTYKAAVASRILAAVLGGYALAALSATALALWLPLHRAEAVITATLASFIIYLIAVLWVFAVRTARRAWLGILAVSAFLAALLWLPGFVGSLI